MGLFKSKEEKARLSNVANLIALSMADGKVQESELAAIAIIATRDGISDKEIKKMIEGKNHVKFTVPKDDATKLRYLKDLVSLMMIDGNIDENELMFCKLVAEGYGFRHEVIDALILSIIDTLKNEDMD